MNIRDYREQVVVRVGKGCNFKCLFCNVAANERAIAGRESPQDMVRALHYRLKYATLANGVQLTISGGEPSIFKAETLFIAKYAKALLGRLGVRELEMDVQTNGAAVDAGFARALRAAGVTRALVSYHSCDPDDFAAVTGMPASALGKVEDGMVALRDAGFDVTVNTVLCRQNVGSFERTVRHLLDRHPYVRLFNVGYFQPHGDGQENLARLLLPYAEAERPYNAALGLLRRAGRPALSHFVGLPPCYLARPADSLEAQSNLFFRATERAEKYLVNRINDANKAHPPACAGCRYAGVCEGLWKEFSGLLEPRPVAYPLFPEGLGAPAGLGAAVPFRVPRGEGAFSAGSADVVAVDARAHAGRIEALGDEAARAHVRCVLLVVPAGVPPPENPYGLGYTHVQADLADVSDAWLEACAFPADRRPVCVDLFLREFSDAAFVRALALARRGAAGHSLRICALGATAGYWVRAFAPYRRELGPALVLPA